MSNWENVISYYQKVGADTPSLLTLAAWLRSRQDVLSTCDDMISLGRLHISRKDRPGVWIQISGCGVKEYLEVTFVTQWVVDEVTHQRRESVHAEHGRVPPAIDEFLARLIAT